MVRTNAPCKALWLIFFLVPIVLHAVSWAEEYTGAEECKACHAKEYDEWQGSGHARILSRVDGSVARAVSLAEEYDEETISYIIGGFKWKALFLDKNGYIITSTPTDGKKTQYNIRSGEWVNYLPEQELPHYNCGECHTTGYSPEGHQNGLEGIRGTWKFDGVQCEVCHGPGGTHVRSNVRSDIKVEKNICVNCHGTKPLDVIPMTSVFLSPYTEANQLLASKKRDFACSDCHNPHARAEESIKQGCAECHEDKKAEYTGSLMDKVGVTCMDCHMPPAGMIAEGDGDSFSGDFKSHLFHIDYRKDFPTVISNGILLNPGYLTVDYACMRCHQTYENRSWAVRYSMFVHSITVTTDIKIKRFQTIFCGIGFFFALLAFLAALSLKNWLWPNLDKKKMLATHRNCAWIAFFIWWFMSAMSVYFLFPFDEPARVLNLGWFLVHLIGGIFGLTFYIGKVLTVRIFRKGWLWQGAFWGIGLFVFWLIDFVTVLFRTPLYGELSSLLF
ncbi:MAG: multiheme c-type cytochrome [Thermodesulfobacteriota bacterium]|nr:multiheme c-type cytochrome [Thermodesulfobacteriota bacterium]